MSDEQPQPFPSGSSSIEERTVESLSRQAALGRLLDQLEAEEGPVDEALIAKYLELLK